MAPPRLRVVPDTNVYISAALKGGLAETILELGALHRLELATSPALLDELAGKLRHKLGWSQNQVRLFLATVRSLARVVKPTRTLSVIAEDEADNRVLECALTAEAALIVTFDQDLLRLKRYGDIGIITPQQLLYSGLEK
jgi:uncharacterized protein